MPEYTDEGKIVVYITKCIYHEYIRLVKQIVLQKSEVNYSSLSEEQLHVLESRNSGKDCYEQIFLSELHQNMEEKEWDIIQKIYIEGKAVSHIAKHSTHHSESIITQTDANAAYFTQMVDSAAVYVNASTRFTDGGEFGLGCEIGISTQKIHARGPMGLCEMNTYKYIIRGTGQTR